MAQAFDRSKFKATSLESLEKQEEHVKATVGDQFENRDGMTYHSYKEDGKHTFRIYPAHPDSVNQNFLVEKFTNALEIESPVYENGQKTDKMQLKRKNVFNAKIHGGVNNDLVDEYIKLVEKQAAEKFNNDQKKMKDYLVPIYGVWVGKNNPNNVMGIKLQESYICYADRIQRDKEPIFGRLEISKSIRAGLKSQAALQEDEDEPVGTEPFSDPDTGRNFVILTDGTKKGTDKYTISIGKKESPLTDEQLEKFMKVNSLEKDYVNCFKRKDLDLQIEGLINFDQKYKFGIIETEQFSELVEKLQEMWPESTENEDVEEEETEEDEDEKDIKAGKDVLPFDKNGVDRNPRKAAESTTQTKAINNADEEDEDAEQKLKNERMSKASSILDKFKKK